MAEWGRNVSRQLWVESCHLPDIGWRMSERPYLVCYDYGTGGLWWWITAPSAEDISATYEDVIVFDEPPSWWTEEDDQNVQRLRLGNDAPGLVKRA